MTDDKEKMLARVRALLTKAEATEFPEEAEALDAKAAAIMSAYNIDAALLAAKADIREMPEDILIILPNPYSLQKAVLYASLVEIFGGKAVQLRSKGDTRLKVYGFPGDMFSVEVMYTSLVLQAASQSRHVPAGVHGKTWRTSFWVGFNNSVIKRLRETQEATKKEATSNEPGTALVLASRDVEVNRMFRQAHPRVRYTRSSYTSVSGYQAGKAAGDSANLHNRSGVTARRRSISS